MIQRLNEDRGATMLEYGLMVALVAIAAMLMVALFGETLKDWFQAIVDVL